FSSKDNNSRIIDTASSASSIASVSKFLYFRFRREAGRDGASSSPPTAPILWGGEGRGFFQVIPTSVTATRRIWPSPASPETFRIPGPVGLEAGILGKLGLSHKASWGVKNLRGIVSCLAGFPGYLGVWMPGCLDAWMPGCLDAWMPGAVEGWREGEGDGDGMDGRMGWVGG
ncbi:hypothetical protein, variant, partial [Blastomyces dermatitidis ATCC 18188]